MAKKKFRPPPPYGPKPYNPNAGTQVGEREYNPNSVTRYNADQFLKNQATAGSVITPGFKEMGDFMNWLQQFVNVNRDEYNTNPFSELKPNPLMAQLRAGINPYPGTRGYIPPTASSRGAPSPQNSMFLPILGPLPPGNKIPPFMPPPRSPSMPLPPKPSPKTPPSSLPKPSPPMQFPKQQLPPAGGAPRPVPPKQVTPKKPTPTPKQVKPTLNSYIPRYERD